MCIVFEREKNEREEEEERNSKIKRKLETFHVEIHVLLEFPRNLLEREKERAK